MRCNLITGRISTDLLLLSILSATVIFPDAGLERDIKRRSIARPLPVPIKYLFLRRWYKFSLSILSAIPYSGRSAPYNEVISSPTWQQWYRVHRGHSACRGYTVHPRRVNSVGNMNSRIFDIHSAVYYVSPWNYVLAAFHKVISNWTFMDNNCCTSFHLWMAYSLKTRGLSVECTPPHCRYRWATGEPTNEWIIYQ